MTKKIIYSLAIFFTILFAVSSCKKGVDKKAEDDLAAAVSGQYNMTYIKGERATINLPTNTQSGKIIITKKDEEVVDVRILITDTENVNNSVDETFEDVQLKKEDSAINLYYQNEKAGTISGSGLTVNLQDQTGSVVIKAKK